ncbi:MAG TPA: N-acetylneuraminate synthase [Phycisphaerae bacterium]|nr:N-acetylneuraminate synthase [Phycisphaerae bacterium]
MDTDTTLFLIPARGGSKRLPGKALRSVGGVTLLGRAIAGARRSAALLGNAAHTIVSTDDSAIADEARRCGAAVPFLRPSDLATDAAPTIGVIRHALDHFAKQGVTFREVVLLQPTSPLRRAEDIVRAVRTQRQHPDHSVVTVRAGAGGSPATQFVRVDDMLHEASSDGAPVVLNGAVYVFAPDWAQRHERLAIPEATRVVVMPDDRSVDVDHAADLARAQAIWEEQSPWSRQRCFVIAEAGVNHDGDVDVARRLIDAAVATGADAVKFQTFSADRLASRAAVKADYQQRTTAKEESQREMLARLALSADDYRTLQAHAAGCGITFLSSAFGIEDVDLLDGIDVPMLKLGSGELTNHPLLAHAAATLRPVICSTGAAYLHEVAAAVDVLRAAGCDHLALLHCVSAYPADACDLNLRAMATLDRAFGVPVGFSDHTMSIEAACAAVALGARIIEKHLTLDRNRVGPDHAASLEPDEFKAMVTALRNVAAALGDGCKQPRPSETSVRTVARKSLVAVRDLPAGAVLRRDDLDVKRPGTGIAPADLELIVGRRLARAVAADALITWPDLGPRDDA